MDTIGQKGSKIWTRLECLAAMTLSSHLRVHVKQGVCVGVDDWGDVCDAPRHVALHDGNLRRGGCDLHKDDECRLAVTFHTASGHLLVEVLLAVGALHLLVHRSPHQLRLWGQKVP